MTRSSAPAQAPRNGITSRCPWTTSVLPAAGRMSADGIFRGVDIYCTDPELRIVATGNVVFTNPEGRLAAESVDFNVVKGTVRSTSPPASCRSAKKSTARSSAIRSPRSIFTAIQSRSSGSAATG